MIGTKEQPRGLNAVLGGLHVLHREERSRVRLMTFDPERDMKRCRAAGCEVHQQNPDISAS